MLFVTSVNPSISGSRFMHQLKIQYLMWDKVLTASWYETTCGLADTNVSQERVAYSR
jgi:hypothetical protein